MFRTAIGFHDAYVAVPTKKAALAAWGAKKDLFGRGAAEIVTDEALSRAPLAAPGEVIKVSRGTTAEQIAALPPDKPKRAKAKEETAPSPAKKSVPKPSRDKLSEAEDAIAEAERHQARQRDRIAAREAELEAEKRALADTQKAEMKALLAARDEQRSRYDAAIEDWQG